MEEPNNPAPFPEPGIYLSMPESVYHSIPAFSKSIVKKFRISDIDAWEALYGDGTETTAALDYGSALHCLVLEGKEAFEARYCKAFDRKAYADALDTVEDLKKFLDGRGSAYPKTAPKASLAYLVRNLAPEQPVLSDLQDAHKANSAGKTELPADAYDEIVSRAWLRSAFLSDVQATEVSFFWVDSTYNIPCKARLDAISFRKMPFGIEARIGDVKTFTNNREKPVADFVAYEVGLRGYHIDALFYSRALKVTPKVFHDAPDTQWPDFKDIAFELLFVEKGRRFPNVLPREVVVRQLGDLTELGQSANGVIQDAANRYRDLHFKHGKEPWSQPHALDYITEAQVPIFFL